MNSPGWQANIVSAAPHKSSHVSKEMGTGLRRKLIFCGGTKCSVWSPLIQFIIAQACFFAFKSNSNDKTESFGIRESIDTRGHATDNRGEEKGLKEQALLA
jgi:hypothetical protein